MPVLTGPGCLTSVSCPPITFPQLTAICNCTTANGGINDLYILPCATELTEVNLTDLDWWDLIVNGDPDATPDPIDPTLGRVGIGLGSISKKGDKKERLGSCRIEQTTSITWALKYVVKCFDKTSADKTRAQFTALIQSSGSFLAIARMCDGDDSVLPIGMFTLSDVDWIVPDNIEEIQSATLELSWKELSLPKVYNVAGLSAILPKAA